MKDLTRITLETEETIVVRRSESIEKMYCPFCSEVTYMAPPHLIAAILPIGQREIFRSIEAEALFSYESDLLRVCLTCLENERRSLCKQ